METFVLDSVLLKLSTGITLTGYTTLRILYEDPDGTTGYWEASVCPSNNKYLQATLYDKLTKNGTWKVQAYIANSSEQYHGKWAELKVYDPLYS